MAFFYILFDKMNSFGKETTYDVFLQKTGWSRATYVMDKSQKHNVEVEKLSCMYHKIQFM